MHQRRPLRLAAVLLLTTLLLAPAGLALAGPAGAPTLSALVTTVLDWWNNLFAPSSTTSGEDAPDSDPNDPKISPTDETTIQTDGTEGDAFPDIDPDG